MHNKLHHGTSYRISLTALILVLIIVQTIAPVVLAEEAQQEESRVTITTWMLVPAVTKGSFGERGELINVTIQLSYPGSGTVNVVSGGGVSNSTRYSALTAIVTASVLLGVDWSTVDFNISFSTQNSISGPSGSFSIALAAYVLLNPILDPGKLHRYVITGAIAPEGLAGRVGGVGVKCEAATRQGYVFVLPLSNIADLRGYECRDYIPVAGILETILRVYGVNMTASVLSPVYPRPLVDSMERAAENMASYAVGNVSLVEKLMSSNELPGSLSRYLSTLIAETRSYVELADKYKDRYPYSAASFAFRALVSALTARYLAEGYIKGEKGYFNERLDAITALLESLKEELDAFSYTTLEQAEILSVAATRIADAEYAVEIAMDYARMGNATNALEELAAADARISSVISWIDSAKELEGSIPITPSLLELLVDRASDLVGVNVQYASSILLEEGFTGHARVLRGILDKAENARESGDVLLALGYYREALTRATMYVFEYALNNLPEGVAAKVISGYIGEADRIAGVLSMSLASHGLYSPLASMYYEYHLVLQEQGEDRVSLYLLWSAIANMELLSLLYIKAPSYLSSLANIREGGGLSGTGVGGPELPLYEVALAAALVIISFSLGYLVSTASMMRSIKSSLRATHM